MQHCSIELSMMMEMAQKSLSIYHFLSIYPCKIFSLHEIFYKVFCLWKAAMLYELPQVKEKSQDRISHRKIN